ncbi:uncharacterized protein LOC128557965 [Mercenaria mercenaria]|uniref:uncharacterized protein LOC128557965 n=1 Tax=Mercenaria mercenaria TaxID=6596 RepID=UPI00234F475A|nr:uncharacterized protein LOC128557965 [Mercenaria mercenaria]
MAEERGNEQQSSSTVAENTGTSTAAENTGTSTAADNTETSTAANNTEKLPAWVVVFLRLCLFSPFKWKNCTLSVSSIHCLWLGVHIAKLVYLTILTIKIGNCRETVSTVVGEGYTALQHTLLKDWDASFETLPYPPAHGKFASYSIDDLKSRINYTVAKESIFLFIPKVEDNILRSHVWDSQLL